MPRKLKLRRHASGWNDEHVRILETGMDWFGEFRCDDTGGIDLIDAHEAWKALRGEIMAAWCERHPGTRPFGWWAYDRPKGSRRECVTGRHPFDDPKNDLPRKGHWGKPGLLRACDIGLEYETEHECLARLSLLTVREMAILKGK